MSSSVSRRSRSSAVAQMNMIQALNSAMDIMLARDPNVVVLGEDVGFFGGVFRVTDGWKEATKYGTLNEGPRLDRDLMFEDVFKEVPEHLRRQREQLHAEQG